MRCGCASALRCSARYDDDWTAREVRVRNRTRCLPDGATRSAPKIGATPLQGLARPAAPGAARRGRSSPSPVTPTWHRVATCAPCAGGAASRAPAPAARGCGPRWGTSGDSTRCAQRVTHALARQLRRHKGQCAWWPRGGRVRRTGRGVAPRRGRDILRFALTATAGRAGAAATYPARDYCSGGWGERCPIAKRAPVALDARQRRARSPSSSSCVRWRIRPVAKRHVQNGRALAVRARGAVCVPV